MRQRVVLYNPRAVFFTMPLPLLAVGSILDRDRYDVKILDGRLDTPQVVYDALEGALCLGITVLTGAPLRDALEVSREARRRFPTLPIVWGGWHPSLFPEMVAAEPSVTAAVMGQGEDTFLELLQTFEAGHSPVGIPGTCCRDERGQVIKGPPRELRDLGEFPPVAYDLINVERYYQLKGVRQLDYISSQGCRFRCNFCADPAVYNRGWYGYSASRMVGELSRLHRQYPFTDVHFQDETWFTQKSRVEEFARALIEANLNITWVATLRADQGNRMDDDLYALCKRSGLRKVIIGLEAGSQEMINFIQKDIKVEDVYHTAQRLSRHGIAAVINVIVGFPGETPESVAETLRVARDIRARDPAFELGIFYFKPYPGNPIAERLEQSGWQFPRDLAGWADFDFVGKERAQGNPWLTPEQKYRIDGFRFYQRFAYDNHPGILRAVLRRVSRVRVEKGWYHLPVERHLIEHLRPGAALS